MRYAILSDIHGNRPALEAVLADARRQGFDTALLLGDVVGYGAEPGACIALLGALDLAGAVRGNHDKVAAGLEPARLFHEHARVAIEWTRDAVIARDKALYRGHPIAAVAASDPHLAEDAMLAIEVEYEVLPPVLDAMAAIAPDAPILHPHMRTAEPAGSAKGSRIRR